MILDRINQASAFVYEILAWPTLRLGPAWTMLWVSAITGILCVWLFGRTSNQKAIESIKTRISGNLIGVRLFQDDLGVVLRLQGTLLGLTLRYMAHSLVPMLVMMAPVVLILAQMNAWYGARPLKVGETALLKVTVSDATMLMDLAVQPTEGLTIDAPPVRIPAEREAVWRLKAIAPSAEPLVLRVDSAELTKSAVVAEEWTPVSSVRGTAWEDRLLYPRETALGKTLGIESVSLSYPNPPLRLLGVELHWLVWFFVLSMVIGFSLKGVLGVQI